MAKTNRLVVSTGTRILLTVLLFTACQVQTGITPPTAPTHSPLPVRATPVATHPVVTASIPTQPAATSTPLPPMVTLQTKPFGPFNFPPSRAGNWPFSITRLGRQPDQLQAAQQAGIQVLIALTGGHGAYTGSNDCFSLEMWKARLDSVDEAIIQQYVDSGTIIGLYAIDEPHHFNNGTNPNCPSVPYADINAACEYANTKWPNLPCGVNTSPAWLVQGLGETDFDSLGFLFTQWNLRQGDVNRWIVQQEADAAPFGLPLYLSVQVITFSPTPGQIEAAGVAMCNSSAAGVLMWKWDEQVFAQPGMIDAMHGIAAACGDNLPES